MKTQLDRARDGEESAAMLEAAATDRVEPGLVREAVARGEAVLPANPAHESLAPLVVGRSFRTKVNANIGRSTQTSSRRDELHKLEIALDAGADFVMDLSVGPGLEELRRDMIAACPAPLGTVPIYEAFWRADNDLDRFGTALFLEVIRDQAEQGVDFMTLHAGILLRHVDMAVGRLMGIVSRGGSLMAEWMVRSNLENPLYSEWNEVLDICHEHDVTVSLGDGLRPGCLADASDEAQFSELEVLGELVQRCRERGVQVMVEGPGHVPFDEIQMNMEKEQEICDKAPFYVLGPVVTDIAPGYDHITSCIGATAAAFHGASLLCYVTPAEHLGLPTCDEVKEGVMAYRIAAHAADVARKLPGARDADDEMARARTDFNWRRQFELAMDGNRARERYERTREAGEDGEDDYCSMCGQEYCALRTTKRLAELRASGADGEAERHE